MIAKVASLYAGSTDGNPFTTSALDTRGATAIVVVAADNGGTSTITDSVGNSYGSPALAPTPAGGVGVQIWVIGAPTVNAAHTWTLGGATFGASIGVVVLSGTALSSLVDQSNSASSTGTTTVQAGSITPTSDNQIVMAGFVSADTYASVDAPFTPADGSVNASGNHEGIAVSFEIQTTATARNPTWTWGFNAAKTAWIISLRAPSGTDLTAGLNPAAALQ